ncbi:hypothetical protein [Bacillus sinesaloumensis]|uniref:hypothetical protein n=1 Tax=Litchfieldia sinesaloumensis TaxID=1926280 RepID=UPI001153A7D9|nr:hypothetical protein [Bacillus sinesaloumensis]
MKQIFSDYGIEIYDSKGHFYLTYDKGELVVNITTIEISKSDAEKAQLSAEDAYQVILKHQNNAKGNSQ